ncbi:MAG: hypothetical protein R3F49_23580 [Planctomycetota bacterium]
MTPRRSPSAAAGLALALAAASALGCITPEVSTTLAGGPIGLSGAFGASSGGAVDATDLGSLGIEGHDGGFLPRVDLDWKGIHLSLTGLYTNRRGLGELDGELSLGGSVISASMPVRTALDLEVQSAVVTWDLVPSERYELALGFGLHLVDLDASVGGARDG